MTIKWYYYAPLAFCLSTAQAQEDAVQPAPDVDRAMLLKISDELGCRQPGKAEAVLGCSILTGFARAGSPDPAILKAEGGLQGKRWLGVTVVSDRSPKPNFAYKATTPFQILIVLGARNGGNFHQALHYPNGLGYTYIRPMNDRQATMIQDAAKTLLDGGDVSQSAPAEFARTTNLQFWQTVPSTGKSVFMREGMMLRQKDKTLYILEIGSSKELLPIYYLSQIRTDQVIR